MTEGCSWALVRSLSIRTFFSCLPDLGRWGCWANGAVYSLKLGSRPAFLEVLPRSDWARYCVSWRRSQRAARRKAVSFTVHSKSIRFVMSEHVNNGPLCRLFRRTPYRAVSRSIRIYSGVQACVTTGISHPQLVRLPPTCVEAGHARPIMADITAERRDCASSKWLASPSHSDLCMRAALSDAEGPCAACYMEGRVAVEVGGLYSSSLLAVAVAACVRYR